MGYFDNEDLDLARAGVAFVAYVKANLKKAQEEFNKLPVADRMGYHSLQEALNELLNKEK